MRRCAASHHEAPVGVNRPFRLVMQSHFNPIKDFHTHKQLGTTTEDYITTITTRGRDPLRGDRELRREWDV